MRIDEGRAMAADLAANARAIAGELAAVEAPCAAGGRCLSRRLTERLNKLLAELGVQIQPARHRPRSGHVRRAERHFRRDRAAAEPPGAVRRGDGRPTNRSGRKLEFLTQEMFRETNTIGSKANDAEIARHVIEMKTAIERMREMIQNVE